MTIDNSELSERLAEAHRKAMNWTEQMMEIIEAADRQDFDEALALTIASELPREVRTRLGGALATKDEDLIMQIINDYKGRLGHAFCESCWSGE